MVIRDIASEAIPSVLSPEISSGPWVIIVVSEPLLVLSAVLGGSRGVIGGVKGNSGSTDNPLKLHFCLRGVFGWIVDNEADDDEIESLDKADDDVQCAGSSKTLSFG